MDTKFYLKDSNYLVYSAKLVCSCGSEPAYLKLESRDDPYTGDTVIRHGFTIDGLPAVNRLDARTDINIGAFGKCSLSSFEYTVMDISAGIEPAKRVLPQTIEALEKMMEGV